MHLLQETLEDIQASGHEVDDIIFIGSEVSGHQCTWNEYAKLADREYDSGYGAQEVASDLVIVFSDGAKMWRHEYDGSECWEYSSPFRMPEEPKAITSLFAKPENVGWKDLAEINAE